MYGRVLRTRFLYSSTANILNNKHYLVSAQSESNVPLDASSTTAPADSSCDATTPPVVLTMGDVTGETASTVDDGVSVIDDATSQVDSLAEQDTIGNVLVDSKSVKGKDKVNWGGEL